jgi:site-specific DNA-methyltransferase (adenine-specific)
VWTFPTVNPYPGKHPCEKPLSLLKHIIHASTRPGALVLDCFAGSGATGEACIATGRQFIGIEMSEHWVNVGRNRLIRHIDAPRQLEIPA